MSYTYIQGTPISTEKPSISQSKMEDNFQALDSYFGNNHVKFSAGSNNGMHTGIQMITQTSSPTTTSIGALYTKTVGSNPELFWHQTTGNEIQMTSGNTSATVVGYSFLPGGLLIQWGIKTGVTNASHATVTFGKTFSINPYSVISQAIGLGGDYSWTNGSITTAGFDLYNSKPAPGTRDFYWIAIGAA